MAETQALPISFARKGSNLRDGDGDGDAARLGFAATPLQQHKSNGNGKIREANSTTPISSTSPQQLGF